MCNQTGHCLHNSPPVIPISSQTNPLRILQVQYTIILPRTIRFAKCFFPSIFRSKISMHIILSYTYYTCRPSTPSRVDIKIKIYYCYKIFISNSLQNKFTCSSQLKSVKPRTSFPRFTFAVVDTVNTYRHQVRPFNAGLFRPAIHVAR